MPAGRPSTVAVTSLCSRVDTFTREAARAEGERSKDDAASRDPKAEGGGAQAHCSLTHAATGGTLTRFLRRDGRAPVGLAAGSGGLHRVRHSNKVVYVVQGSFLVRLETSEMSSFEKRDDFTPGSARDLASPANRATPRRASPDKRAAVIMRTPISSIRCVERTPRRKRVVERAFSSLRALLLAHVCAAQRPAQALRTLPLCQCCRVCFTTLTQPPPFPSQRRRQPAARGSAALGPQGCERGQGLPLDAPHECRKRWRGCGPRWSGRQQQWRRHPAHAHSGQQHRPAHPGRLGPDPHDARAVQQGEQRHEQVDDGRERHDLGHIHHV